LGSTWLLQNRKACKVAGAVAGVAAASVSFLPTPAQCEGATSSHRVRTLKAKLFGKIDESQDGQLSRAEIEAAFREMDTSGDHRVSYEEFNAYLVRHGLKPEKISQYRTREELFAELDKDGSGFIEHHEFHDHFGGLEYALRYAAVMVHSFLAKGRLIAYTSEVGESFRPVMPLWFVNTAYVVSFAYVGIDIAYDTVTAYLNGDPSILIARTCLHTSIFQLLASMALPAIIIHQVVHFTQHQLHRLPKTPYTRWVPTMIGFCCIPLMPLLDPPIEHAIDATFHHLWPVDQDAEKKH